MMMPVDDDTTFAHYRVDLGGTVVLLDKRNHHQLSTEIGKGSKAATVTDLFGSPTRIVIAHIECTSLITAHSRARYRAWSRQLEAAIDGLDPEGSGSVLW
jgi:hypothetical protein